MSKVDPNSAGMSALDFGYISTGSMKHICTGCSCLATARDGGGSLKYSASELHMKNKAASVPLVLSLLLSPIEILSFNSLMFCQKKGIRSISGGLEHGIRTK